MLVQSWDEFLPAAFTFQLALTFVTLLRTWARDGSRRGRHWVCLVRPARIGIQVSR